MGKTLIEEIESTPEGRLNLNVARDCLKVTVLLNRAFELSGLSIEKFAEALGVDVSRAEDILNGDGNVKIATLSRVLSVCGVEWGIDSSLPPVGPRIRRKRDMS